MIPPPDRQLEQVRAAADYISSRTDVQPSTGLILGTGLGELATEIDVELVLPYEEVPHFPRSTVESHEGRLILGHLDGLPVIAMQGRFHLYEGYSALDVTFPVRVMAEMGADTLLVSNAAGGMNPEHRCSDLLLITDHINLQGANPLEGPNVDDWGPRFPDMSEPYDRELREIALSVASENGIHLHEGVYVAVVGPNLETRAEYAYLHEIGGDVVGMSTAPEVIAARHSGMRCMAVSVITDECVPETLQSVSIEDVLAAAAEAEPRLATLFRGVAGRLARVSTSVAMR